MRLTDSVLRDDSTGESPPKKMLAAAALPARQNSRNNSRSVFSLRIPFHAIACITLFCTTRKPVWTRRTMLRPLGIIYLR